MLGRKQLKPFHVERWDLAHRAVDYPRWATAGAVYDITYEHVRFPSMRKQNASDLHQDSAFAVSHWSPWLPLANLLGPSR